MPFPSTVVPLVIFEARYRVLFNTLLAGCPSIEEGLVQTDSPFCGTRQFGMCYFQKDKLSGIGTTLHIDEYVHLPDGRMVVTTKGTERFKITSVIKEKPVLVCEVEVLPEDNDTSEQAKTLASEVADLFRETLRLHMKVQGREVAGEELQEPEGLADRSPAEVSYWIAGTFLDNRDLQLLLLEENSTVKRLELERDILKKTVQYYVAVTAVNSAFTSETSSGAEARVSAEGGEGKDGSSDSSKGGEGRPPVSGPD